MHAADDVPPQADIAALARENAELQRKVAALAEANAHAAELMAALEEANEREQALVARGVELSLQTRVDTILQDLRTEEEILDEVCRELQSVDDLTLNSVRVEMFPTAGYCFLPEDQEEGGGLRIRSELLPTPYGAEMFDAVLEVARQEGLSGAFWIPIRSRDEQLGRLHMVSEAQDARWCQRWRFRPHRSGRTSRLIGGSCQRRLYTLVWLEHRSCRSGGGLRSRGSLRQHPISPQRPLR